MTKKVWLITLFFSISTFAQQKENLVFTKPYIGSAKGSTFNLFFAFGIEQWENAKQSKVYSQWTLICSSQDSATGEVKNTCNLDENKIDTRWSVSKNSGSQITNVHKSTDDGSMTIRKIDWRNGVLDFAVHYLLSENPLEVRIRFLREADSLYLDSFNAVQITRGVFADILTSVELRIPEYDYVVQIPLEMRGMKNELMRRRERLASLSPKDIEIWKRLEKSNEFFSILAQIGARRKAILPDYDGKQT
jgi:hypothetical protein